MSYIRVENLSFHIGDKEILHNLSLEMKQHKFLGLLGPNGSGKSTLLKHIYRVNAIQKGQIYIDGVPLHEMPLLDAAQKIGVMGQFHSIDFDFTVYQIALMGRTPYKKSFDSDTPYDLELVEKYLKLVGMWESKDRYFSTLSGGEQQRVMLARVLVQEPEFLILDEPTNHLDITYQLQLLKVVKGLGIGVVAALHDLNLASMFCDELCIMKKGNIIEVGSPKEILRKDLIRSVYGVDSEVSYNERGIPRVLYKE